MDARRVGNVADHLVRVEIDDDDVGRVRDIQAPGGGVGREVVPAAFATDLDIADDVIASRRGERRSDGCESTSRCEHQTSHMTPLTKC